MSKILKSQENTLASYPREYPHRKVKQGEISIANPQVLAELLAEAGRSGSIQRTYRTEKKQEPTNPHDSLHLSIMKNSKWGASDQKRLSPFQESETPFRLPKIRHRANSLGVNVLLYHSSETSRRSVTPSSNVLWSESYSYPNLVTRSQHTLLSLASHSLIIYLNNNAPFPHIALAALRNPDSAQTKGLHSLRISHASPVGRTARLPWQVRGVAAVCPERELL